MKSQIVLFLFFLTISFLVKAQDLWTFEKDTQGFSKGIGFDSNNYIHTVSLDRDQLDAFISKIENDIAQITLKIGNVGLSEMVQTFRRYSYNIVSGHEEDSYLDGLKERSDYLNKYLNM